MYFFKLKVSQKAVKYELYMKIVTKAMQNICKIREKKLNMVLFLVSGTQSVVNAAPNRHTDPYSQKVPLAPKYSKL